MRIVELSSAKYNPIVGILQTARFTTRFVLKLLTVNRRIAFRRFT